MRTKKYITLFSSCLAFLFGAGTAAAQTATELPVYYEAGTNVTSITSGQKVCLTPAGQTDYNEGKYLSWNGKTGTSENEVEAVSSIGEKAIFTFEATGNTIEGYSTYYLKNEANGMYVRKATRSSNEDDEEPIRFTSKAEEAFELTVEHPDEGATADDWRIYSTSGGTQITVTPEAYIIAAPEKQHDKPVYLLAYLTWNEWQDTNEWYIQTVNEQSAGMTLSNSIVELMPKGMDVYEEGDGVGYLSTELYNALNNAYITAQNTTSSSNRDVCNAAYAALVQAKANATAALVVPADKYYFFVNLRNTAALATNGSKLTYKANFEVPSKASVSDAAYIWKAIDAGDGYVYLQNYNSGLYAGTVGSNSTAIPVTEQPSAKYKVTYNASLETSGGILAGYFNITPERSSSVSFNLDTWNQQVVFWGDLSSDEGDQWHVYAISDDDIAAMAQEVEQQKLNDELNTLYREAYGTYGSSRSYNATEGDVKNGEFDAEGLITEPAQLTSNAKQSTEGSYEGVLDKDYTTYFHTQWSGDAVNEPHYLQIDLYKEYQTLVLKMAKRFKQQDVGHPQAFDIYATNDTTGTWNYEGSYNVDWSYAYTVEDSVCNKTVGIAGFQMSKPYRYIRFAVTATTLNQLFGSYPFWYVSEFRAYEAQYDAANSSYNTVSEAVRTNFEAQLAAAGTEFVNGTATRTTIDALQAAYDALLAELPMPSRLTAAIADAKTQIPTAIGEEMGQYPQAAVDAFNSTIAEVEATVKDLMSLSEINAGLAAVEEALATLNASLVKPEVGKFYTIRGLTTDANNTRALNAIVYSTGNSTTANLRSLQANEDGSDAIDPMSDLKYVWCVEELNGDSIVLYNAGTGFYLGKQTTLNGAISNVPQKTAVQLVPIRSAAGFYLKVSDDLYVNFQGQGINMVAWNSASGTDNSSLTFQEEDVDQYSGTINWNVSANRYQVITLPFDIITGFNGEGEAYDVLGIKTEGDVNTIELKKYDDNDVILRGLPFVFKAAEGVTSVAIMTLAEEVDDLTYDSTNGGDNGNGALVGNIAEITIEGNDKAILSNGSAVLIGSTTSASLRSLGANSGYFDNVVTEETGDASITLPGAITTGIDIAEALDANALVDVYTIAGVQVRHNVKAAAATNGLPAGLYVVGSHKVLVK